MMMFFLMMFSVLCGIAGAICLVVAVFQIAMEVFFPLDDDDKE